MAFKSHAQRRWALKQVEDGKWTKEQFKEWDQATRAKLPERTQWKSIPAGPQVRVIRANRPLEK